MKFLLSVICLLFSFQLSAAELCEATFTQHPLGKLGFHYSFVKWLISQGIEDASQLDQVSISGAKQLVINKKISVKQLEEDSTLLLKLIVDSKYKKVQAALDYEFHMLSELENLSTITLARLKNHKYRTLEQILDQSATRLIEEIGFINTLHLEFVLLKQNKTLEDRLINLDRLAVNSSIKELNLNPKVEKRLLDKKIKNIQQLISLPIEKVLNIVLVGKGQRKLIYELQGVLINNGYSLLVDKVNEEIYNFR